MRENTPQRSTGEGERQEKSAEGREEGAKHEVEEEVVVGDQRWKKSPEQISGGQWSNISPY